MPRPLPPVVPSPYTARRPHSDPDRGDGALCWALYRSGASWELIAEMRCQWDVIYVRIGSRFERAGFVCIHCGETRGR
jgi:hypothetical protein